MNGAPDVVIFFSTELEDFAAIDTMIADAEQEANDARPAEDFDPALQEGVRRMAESEGWVEPSAADCLAQLERMAGAEFPNARAALNKALEKPADVEQSELQQRTDYIKASDKRVETWSEAKQDAFKAAMRRLQPADADKSEDTTYEWPNYCTACGSFWYNCVCEDITEEGDDA